MKRIVTLLLMVCCVMTGSSMARVDPYSFYPSKRYKPKMNKLIKMFETYGIKI